MVNASSNELLLGLQAQVKALAEEVQKLSSASNPPVIRGIDGLAEFLGVGKNTAQNMKNDGIVPYYQHGRIVLFRPEEVFNALERVTPKYKR
ncbi:helix-turn-helix domain-containing protein [uncultured Alistipes sp.]|jgi:hypothetical protein|uniref:helix-turn-helix domain-containing protein n=1 Tax=uncultured Alistipes sp. TaxID=538949 RepID=UPI0025CF3206|nr:helix-turn-helix domain-containing protein [uncultured Alistipes sp.]